MALAKGRQSSTAQPPAQNRRANALVGVCLRLGGAVERVLGLASEVTRDMGVTDVFGCLLLALGVRFARRAPRRSNQRVKPRLASCFRVPITWGAGCSPRGARLYSSTSERTPRRNARASRCVRSLGKESRSSAVMMIPDATVRSRPESERAATSWVQAGRRRVDRGGKLDSTAPAPGGRDFDL